MAGLQIVSLNCHGFNAATVQYVRSSLISVDCILLQETWLSDKTAYHLNDAVSDHFICFHTSAMEEKINSSILTGRPFGGTAILFSSRLAKHTNCIITNSSRVTAVQLTNNKQQNIVISCIDMPWNDGSADHLVEYISVLGCL